MSGQTALARPPCLRPALEFCLSRPEASTGALGPTPLASCVTRRAAGASFRRWDSPCRATGCAVRRRSRRDSQSLSVLQADLPTKRGWQRCCPFGGWSTDARTGSPSCPEACDADSQCCAGSPLLRSAETRASPCLTSPQRDSMNRPEAF